MPVIYLAAIVAANLLIARLGPVAAPLVGMVFIGLDITARDTLHERWQHRGLWWKMALLIGTGSALSWLLNRNAGPVALASFIAFAASGIVDAVVYHLLRSWPRLAKVNGSNLISAAVDSIVFPTIAFGGFIPSLVALQFAFKVAGGLLWSLVLTRHSGTANPGKANLLDAVAGRRRLWP